MKRVEVLERSYRVPEPPPSLAVLWIVNVHERKPRQRKKLFIIFYQRENPFSNQNGCKKHNKLHRRVRLQFILNCQEEWKSLINNFWELWILFHAIGAIADFRVSTAILNTIRVSRRWCKFNFVPLKTQVKSCHFSEGRDGRKKCFYFF